MKTMAPAQDNGFLSWEVFWLGGCSILVCLSSWAFTDKSASLMTMSQLAAGLAFAVNHPHFLSSYALLYSDFQKNIFKRARYFWAAVIVPVVLGSFLFYAFAAGRGDLLGYSLNLMFFLVGWHYVKQIFGCVIVTSVRRGIFYGKWERRILLLNLFSLWGLSFCRGQTGSQSFMFYGITYPALGLPDFLPQLSYILIFASALAVVGMHIRKYVEHGIKPSAGGLAALGAIYVWYLPTFQHPVFAYLIPLFHSAQYLVFVASFKSNQVGAEIKALKPREQRVKWMRDFVSYGVTVALLGALAFEFVPKFLDTQHWLNNPSLGTSPFLAAFLIFINVHHYFIDNVIWRSDNEQVKKYLFARPTAEVNAAPSSATARAA